MRARGGGNLLDFERTSDETATFKDKINKNEINIIRSACAICSPKSLSHLPQSGTQKTRVSSLELVTSNITDIGSTKTAISVAMPSVDYLNHLRGQALSATCCSILPLNYAAAAPTVFLATRSPVKQMLPAGEENQSKLTVTKKSDKISEWICTLPFVGSGQTCVQLVSIGSCNEIVTICSRNATFDQVESKTYNHFQNHCNVGSVNKN